MDIGFEDNHWLAAPTAHAFGGGCSGAPEWQELRARLGAAWSARRELAYGDHKSAGRSGSFDRTSVLALARFETRLSAVNPIALGNLKSRGGNAGLQTGVSTPGGRG